MLIFSVQVIFEDRQPIREALQPACTRHAYYSESAGVYDLKQGWATVLVRGPQLLWYSKLRATLWTIAIKQSYTIKRSLIPAVALQDR